ncbi:uncharacterized protein CC84DRAFT_69556 [Paraphaeosphaeria sporulosa]|uniref:Uncharacterized protein n=1 Tax=Paraphaeosphaeria sporulosa TaxID=1460663 RepID=A0A177CX74_9PLEO|nr:uncharacterized protein CC84DRAFT_69556 [Paraphaeosphaeria sporulosa]OAG12155.1 hypothetical protein CC84DRAFT_69556 [Paraphaeosphaeria sporulosa]
MKDLGSFSESFFTAISLLARVIAILPPFYSCTLPFPHRQAFAGLLSFQCFILNQHFWVSEPSSCSKGTHYFRHLSQFKAHVNDVFFSLHLKLLHVYKWRWEDHLQMSLFKVAKQRSLCVFFVV